MTRESDYYDVERVKVFFMEVKFLDVCLFINVCDCYEFVLDLMIYFYNNNMLCYIEGYV